MKINDEWLHKVRPQHRRPAEDDDAPDDPNFGRPVLLTGSERDYLIGLLLAKGAAVFDSLPTLPGVEAHRAQKTLRKLKRLIHVLKNPGKRVTVPSEGEP